MRPRKLAGPAFLLALLLVLSGPPTAGAGPVVSPGALVQVSGSSPFVSPDFDPNCGLVGQSGTNYVNSEVEPWIEVNPTNPDNIVGLWQQDRWSNGGARGLVAGVSMDGGSNWQSVIIPKISECSGEPTFERATDPWLSFAPNGELYSISLSFDNTSSDNALLVNESDDGGLTWSDPVSIVDGSDGFGFNDKESITADPNDSNYVYAVWQRVGQAWFARTTTAGTTDGVWEPARAIWIPPGGERSIAHQIVVLPASEGGDLINAFARSGKGNKRFVDFLRSTDNGATWTGPFTISTLQSIGITDPETGQGVRAGTNIPDVAVDPTSGDLYAVWQDARFDGISGRGRNKRRHDSIAFSSSTDGGVTWSAPIKVNQTPTTEPPGDQQAFTASVDVAQDGTIAVTYYDFRNNTSDPATLLTDYWTVHCHPDPPASTCATTPGAWFETQVTDTSFDLSEAPVAGGLFVGDYEGLDSEGGSYLPFFSQTHTGDPASIYFRRVGP
jgi:hypothetical protein